MIRALQHVLATMACPCTKRRGGAKAAYCDITFMKGASHKENNIVDHVAISAVVQESAQGLISLHVITQRCLC